MGNVISDPLKKFNVVSNTLKEINDSTSDLELTNKLKK